MGQGCNGFSIAFSQSGLMRRILTQLFLLLGYFDGTFCRLVRDQRSQQLTTVGSTRCCPLWFGIRGRRHCWHLHGDGIRTYTDSWWEVRCWCGGWVWNSCLCKVQTWGIDWHGGRRCQTRVGRSEGLVAGTGATH